MQIDLRYKGKSNVCTEIYRDGGSLELRFLADDDKRYCIFMEVVMSSPDDCKRYQPPMLFKGDFYINNSQAEDYIAHITWQQVANLLQEIKQQMGEDYFSIDYHFPLIEKIANNGGWREY